MSQFRTFFMLFAIIYQQLIPIQNDYSICHSVTFTAERSQLVAYKFKILKFRNNFNKLRKCLRGKTTTVDKDDIDRERYSLM